MSSQSVDLVVASFGENLSWIKWVPKHWRVFVYNAKEGRTDFPEGVTPIHVPNGGREAGQYFQHLIRNYGDHSEYTIFIQGMPFDHSAKFLVELFTEEVPMSGPIRYIGGFPLPPVEFTLPVSGYFLDVLKRVYKDSKIPNPIPGNVGAQFYVRKDVILDHPKAVYKRFLNEAYAEHPLSFGHLIEPHWGCVFNWPKFV